MKYRIIFEHGEYQLQTPPCTSSAWDTKGCCMFAWPLHIKAAWIALTRHWYRRGEGYKREFGETS